MHVRVLFIIYLLLMAVAASQHEVALVNTKITRLIDLAPSHPIAVIDINVRNVNSDARSTPVGEYVIYVPRVSQLLDFHVSDSTGPLTWRSVDVPTKAPRGHTDFALRAVRLWAPLVPGGVSPHKPADVPTPLDVQSSCALRVQFTWRNLNFNQNSSKRTVDMLYHDTAQVVSPYATAAELTRFKLPLNKVHSFSKIEPASFDASTGLLSYGVYHRTAPMHLTPITVSFPTNALFLRVSDCVSSQVFHRDGSTHVRTQFILHNDAPPTVGFSRLGYERSKSRGSTAKDDPVISVVRVELPTAAYDIQYQDSLGYRHSAVVVRSSQIVDLSPRYPLLGGWSADFIVSYRLPPTAPANNISIQFPIAGLSIDHALFDSCQVDFEVPPGSVDMAVASDRPFLQQSITKSSWIWAERSVIRVTQSRFLSASVLHWSFRSTDVPTYYQLSWLLAVIVPWLLLRLCVI